MKKIIGITAVLGLAFAAQAAVTIGTVGDGIGYDTIGTQASSFYTTSETKSFDVGTADNQYGSDGYLVFGGDQGNINGDDYGDTTRYAEKIPTFFTGGSFIVDTGATLVRNNTSQVPMDDPDAAINGADFAFSGYLMNNSSSGEQTMLQFAVANTDATSFRFGVIAGNENGTSLDPIGLSLAFSDGTSASVTTLETFNGYDPTTDIGMVFFDVALDANTTGTFTLLATEGGGNPTIGGVTFDVIPEPATLGLVAMFGGGIVFIRRRFML